MPQNARMMYKPCLSVWMRAVAKYRLIFILVHAQDHIMTSMLARELIAELIEVQRRLQHRA